MEAFYDIADDEVENYRVIDWMRISEKLQPSHLFIFVKKISPIRRKPDGPERPHLRLQWAVKAENIRNAIYVSYNADENFQKIARRTDGYEVESTLNRYYRKTHLRERKRN